MLRKELMYYSVARRLDTTVRRLVAVGRLESTAYADVTKKSAAPLGDCAIGRDTLLQTGGMERVQCATNSYRCIET